MRILRYRYKPKASTALLAILGSAGLAYLLANMAQTNKRGIILYHLISLSPDNATIFLWILAAFCAFFAVASAFGLWLSLMSSRELILTETELHAPPGTIMPGKSRVVRLSDIAQLKLLTTTRGGRYLYAWHPRGKVMINERLMPDAEAFEEFCSELANRARRSSERALRR
jgi:hypothetical protein